MSRPSRPCRCPDACPCTRGGRGTLAVAARAGADQAPARRSGQSRPPDSWGASLPAASGLARLLEVAAWAWPPQPHAALAWARHAWPPQKDAAPAHSEPPRAMCLAPGAAQAYARRRQPAPRRAALAGRRTRGRARGAGSRPVGTKRAAMPASAAGAGRGVACPDHALWCRCRRVTTRRAGARRGGKAGRYATK